MDHEALYRLIYERQWAALLDALHRHREAVAADALLARAAETFVTAFFEALAGGAPEALAEELEKLFLLHTGGFYRLPEARFEQVVEALVRLHADRPEAALGYARFCPHNPRCAAVLRAHAPPEPIQHAQADTLDVASTSPLADADATLPLFKSQQEADFFLAVREVFATYFVYPNVALSCLVDYEHLREHLSGEERRYFFRALVDCVVFDQHDGYRPRFFFELDSPLHDTEERQAKDRHKERILALAGQRLFRIRRREAGTGRAAFVALLKELAERDEDAPAPSQP